jgi:hypothetical protein
MTALEQLNAYFRDLETRMRAMAAWRGVAATSATAFGLTLLLVWIANGYQFATSIVIPFRILLFGGITTVAFALLIPIKKLTRKHLARLAETRVPEFEQRLLTAEREDAKNPFSELLAEDALRIARRHPPEEFAPQRFIYGFGATAGAACALLVWLIAAGPGFWGYGAALLWTGNASAARRPIYDIAVSPGNTTVRRNSDQAITARLLGFSAPSVSIYAKYDRALKWESVPMQPQPGGNGYRFVFAGLTDSVDYYIQAGARESRHFRLAVKDLPSVKRLRVRVHFPPALGLPDAVSAPGGDIRAVKGSEAIVSVLTDKPLDSGVLMLDGGKQIPLQKQADGWMAAQLPLEKDGTYHVAAIDRGEAVRISDDYFIQAKSDEPPTVAIVRPGRDTHVSPIEELPVTVKASDDFGIEAMELHYSVNGGPEHTVSLLKQKNLREAENGTTLYLEDFHLVPGDLVSFYATARDANTTSRSDIFFAQAEPFDLKFMQSQQAGGMAGGNQADDIVEREKQIVAATYNELKQPKGQPAEQEDAKSLAQVQAKLSEQEKTLASRMSDRDMTEVNPQLAEMTKLMAQAASQMDSAAAELGSARWQGALPPEQKALQSLSRIDAMYRDFQVAFGGMGNAGMSGAQRDLARMFDLEMDMSKNQYETGQSASDQGSGQKDSMDKIFERLQALARRQQELAAQRPEQKAFEQRWQEEQLRREAEELQKQMRQLASQSPGSSPSDMQHGQQSASESDSSPTRQTVQAASSGDQNRQMTQAMREAAQALQRAEEDMRKAAEGSDQAAGQRAAEELARAKNALDQALQKQADSSMASLTRQAQQLAEAQRRIADRMKQMYGSGSEMFDPRSEIFPNEGETARNRQEPNSADGGVPMPQMTDPMNPIPYGYGNYWFRRRYLPQLTPPHMPAPEERGLANAKDQLATQVEQLEKQLQRELQNLEATQPDAAAKLRKALSALEEEDLAMRMRKNAEWMREGFGDRNLPTEDSMARALDQLSRNLQQAQQAIRPSASASGQNDSAEQALNDLWALREQMQQAQQAQGNGSTNQAGREQGESGAWAPLGSEGPSIDRDQLKSAITDLNRLRAQMRPNDHSYRYLDYTLGYLVHLYHADPNVLRAAIAEDAINNLERLEIELAQHAGANVQGGRTGTPEAAPQKYKDAVADYFKKLSQ